MIITEKDFFYFLPRSQCFIPTNVIICVSALCKYDFHARLSFFSFKVMILLYFIIFALSIPMNELIILSTLYFFALFSFQIINHKFRKIIYLVLNYLNFILNTDVILKFILFFLKDKITWYDRIKIIIYLWVGITFQFKSPIVQFDLWKKLNIDFCYICVSFAFPKNNTKITE